MKTITFASAQLICAVLLLTFCTTVFSQNINTWKGGTPGMEHEWNCPKNWSNYNVPDGFTDVIIPDVSSTSLAMPVIQKGIGEVNSISIASNSMLTIRKDAQLIVHCKMDGFAMENITLEGTMLVPEEVQAIFSKKAFAGKNR